MSAPCKPCGLGRILSSAGLCLALAAAGGCSSVALDEAPEAAPSGGSGGSDVTGGGNATSSGGGSSEDPSPGAPDYYSADYPKGPYGTEVGSIIEDFAFLGWRDPVRADYDIDKFEIVRLSEFYNPDGRSDVRLIWINASAVWCTVCRAEMRDIKNNKVNEVFGAKGVQLIETLFEDNGSGPATPLDLQRWGKTPDHAIDFPLLLDPGFKLGAFFTSDATPLNMLVDARNMKIIDATMGYSLDYWQRVDELLSR